MPVKNRSARPIAETPDAINQANNVAVGDRTSFNEFYFYLRYNVAHGNLVRQQPGMIQHGLLHLLSARHIKNTGVEAAN